MQRNVISQRVFWSFCSRHGKEKRNFSFTVPCCHEEANGPARPLYNYTSGRWLYNEHLRLSERRLHFNIDALCHVVVKAVGQRSTDLASFAKIAEGSSYRIFEATFQDGSKVIARLPYPCTIPRRYGIASEVATMEFLRMHGIPIPRVFDWSSSSSNDIGSEYIVMERVQGRELSETWLTMTFKDRMNVIEKIVDMERALFDIQFPANGSLFFKDSLDSGVKSVGILESIQEGTDRFCVGPSTEYLWCYQMRNELATSRGPWESSEELLKAVGERELLWLQRFGKTRYPREPLYREFYDNKEVDPKFQIDQLSAYLKVAPYLVPKARHLNKPTIRHPDLSPSNIFISESGDITGIIDWQHSAILPIFLQAKIPKHFQNYGDDASENFQRPMLAADFASMTDSEKQEELELYRRRQLYEAACRPWEGDNTSLQAELIRILEHWSDITSSEEIPPVCYTPEEVKECVERDSKQKKADSQMQMVRDFIGINIEGWISNEEYEEAREKEVIIRNELAEGCETDEERRDFDKYWPFQDHEEID